MIKDTIRELRKSKGMTQVEFAEIMSCNRQKIADWERGKSTPSADDIILLCKKFGVSSDYILGLSIYPTQDKGLAAAAEYLGLTEEAALSLKSAEFITQNKELKALSFAFDQAIKSDFLTSLCLDVNLYCINKMMYADIIMQKADNESKEEALKRIMDADPHKESCEAALYRVQKRSIDFCDKCADIIASNKDGDTNGNDQKT